MSLTITDDLDLLINCLAPHIGDPIRLRNDKHELLEVVMDLGRLPEARFPGRELALSEREVTESDIEYVVSRISEFGEDNRAGIERTLHRISCIRNRRGRIVGLTCRVGRAIFGTIAHHRGHHPQRRERAAPGPPRRRQDDDAARGGARPGGRDETSA